MQGLVLIQFFITNLLTVESVWNNQCANRNREPPQPAQPLQGTGGRFAWAAGRGRSGTLTREESISVAGWASGVGDPHPTAAQHGACSGWG